MSGRVLVVDDSLTVRMDLSEAFAAAGFSVTACATEAEARAALAGAAFDLVVLDVLLPFADGVDLLREIRQTPRIQDMVVILLSSLAQVRARIRGLRMGADDYVGKPYEAAYLIARSRELLRERGRMPARGGATVLVIDDSLTFREQLREALRQAGYEAAVAVSGENGLRMAADIRPAAIIVDGEMPGLDGLSVIRRLRLDAGLRHTPCLLLTAASGQETELQALESGADAFVCKSDGGAVVLARLAAILRGTGAPTAAPSLMGPKKILAVDDDEIFLGRIMADLKREGYDVVPAQDGEEALELLEAEKVDCVLLDLAMPGLGGVETCRRLKANPATRRLPVILFSARGDGAAMLEALGAGADDVVPKSGDFALLRARLLAQIRRRQFADEKRGGRE
jgi:DNA-binding response OmpR family regulator